MPKALIIFDSTFGNTEKVAKALANGLENGGATANIVKVDEAKPDELTQYDLLCVGSPTHAWNASKPVKDFLDSLKTVEGLQSKKAFAFDTKMKSRLAGNAVGKIESRLKDLGLNVIRRSESAVVKGREGPLEENAEQTFKQIGLELAKSL